MPTHLVGVLKDRFHRNEFHSNELVYKTRKLGTMRTLTEEDIRTRAYKELLADRASENSAPNVARRGAIRRRRNIVPMVAR